MTRGETAAQHASADLLREARDPGHRQSRALLLAEANGPEVARGKARTAALAKQPVKLRGERVKERPFCACGLGPSSGLARSSEPVVMVGRGVDQPMARRRRQRQEDGARQGGAFYRLADNPGSRMRQVRMEAAFSRAPL
jgi:hypothetical protein